MTSKDIYDAMPKHLKFMINFSGAAITFVVYQIGCQALGL